MDNKNNTQKLSDNLKYDNESGELIDTSRLSIQDFTGNAKDIFSTYKSKYENTMSSAIILLFFGIVGIIWTVLFITDTIHVTLSTFQYIFLGIIYIVFLGYGVISFFKALEYKALINDETTCENEIIVYLKENVTKELLDSFHDDSISDEENYVNYISKISDMIIETYPNYDKGLIEYHIDDYLNEHF